LKYKGGVEMPGVKQKIIQMIESLPEDVTVDDIIAELYFRLQVDAGLKELDEGKWIPHEDIEKRICGDVHKIINNYDACNGR
jgi:hypothetical protein